MKQQSFKRNEERGATLVIVAGGFFVLLATIGFAVDSANLYRAQTRLQRAVDAGAISGAYALAASGKAAAERTARKVALGNLGQSGMRLADPAHDLQITFDNPTSPSRIQVDASAVVRLFILDMVPGYPTQSGVKATAAGVGGQSEKNYAISLVLDTSGSMGDPACLGCSQTKFEALKEAAAGFVDLLDNAHDLLSVVSFDNEVRTQMTMRSNFQALAKDIILGRANTRIYPDSVDFQRADGWTNIEGAILAGSQQLAAVDPNEYKKVLILVTDGSPTYDSNDDHVCSSNGDTFFVDSTGKVCYNPLTCVGARTSCTIPDKRRCYIKTVAAGDTFRAQNPGGTLTSIGIGVSETNVRDGAYQDLADDSSLKGNLMRRLSNTTQPAGSPVDPAFDCVQNASDYNAVQRTHGEYMPTPDARQLASLFRRVFDGLGPRLVT